ncbi:hypothetical protein [Halorubrum sp. CSM-61]|uniref:hypothetical protein n=1 Tax=Halorubrum sp. CSM-61 TaxID=2485838 RepID=UPI000F4BE6D6|nr:hypothetical protein [Halorubrum sp. CSM-61]
MHATDTRRGDDDTITMPSGETVPVEMGDAVLPCVTEFDASVGVCIEDGRIKMYDGGDCTLSLGVSKRSIDDPDPVATLYASINLDTGDDDIYSETAFEDTADLRTLRDALTTALRYRGADVGLVETFETHKAALSDDSLHELRLRIEDEVSRRAAREREAERESRGETDE